MSLPDEDRISELERANALLREELWLQWSANHAEHCDNEWLHPNPERICMWPVPEILRGDG